MNIKFILILVFGIVTACCQVLVGATFIFWFSKFESLPKESNKILFTGSLNGPQLNSLWYYYYFPIFVGVLNLVLAIFEVLLIIPPLHSFTFLFNSPVFRAVFYFVTGIIALGYAGDLGIVACALGLLSGGLTVVSGILSNI